MTKKPVDHLICPMCEKHICKHSKPMMVRHQEKLIEAAFAKGVLKGLLGISKCVNEARAAQIAKLTSKDSIAKIIEATHTEPIYPFIRTLSEAEFKRAEKRQHDSVRAAIKKASECAPIPKNDTAVVTAGADAPEKAFELYHCFKCNQMTNHLYDREREEMVCQKCKPKKR
jgi:hypothetical protein